MDITKTYRFVPASNPPAESQVDLVGLYCDSSFGFTDYVNGSFFPKVSHYLAEDTAPFDRYAEAATSETIDHLESQLENLKNQPIQLRDLFAIAALVGEFASNRGTTVEQAVNFSYGIADKMLVAREADNG